ncbi:MAG TPA: TolC family protein [Anaeromyxobacter sp.]|nr:TolC family protein [Anaeromyxobacter sp.]
MNAKTAALAVALALGAGRAQAQADTNAAAPAGDQLTVLPADATGPVITLDQALEAAEQRNLDLRALAAQLDEAGEISWKALSYYLPQVTVGATYTRQDEVHLPLAAPVPGQPGPVYNAFVAVDVEFQRRDLVGLQANATQTLVSPRLYYAIRGAKESQRATTLNLENGRRQVIFGVARAYYATAALNEAVGVSGRLLEIAQRQEKDSNVRYQAGAIAKVGLIRAQIDRAQAEEDLRRARAAFLSAKVALAALLDRDTAFEVTAPPELAPASTDLEELVRQADRSRPDVEAFRVQERVEEANKQSALSRYLPDVQLFGKYQWANQLGLNDKHDAWSGGLQLQWTILDGFLRESDIRTADAKIAEARARAEGATVQVRQEVSQALLDLESARANAQKSKEQRDLAAENLRLVDVAYRAGTATAVELADATAQLRNAENGVTRDTLNAQLAALQVLNAAGSFNPRKP